MTWFEKEFERPRRLCVVHNIDSYSIGYFMFINSRVLRVRSADKQYKNCATL